MSTLYPPENGSHPTEEKAPGHAREAESPPRRAQKSPGPRKPVLLHPFLLAILPILFLYSHNMSELSIDELLLPLVIAAGASLLVWLLSAMIMHERLRAGLLASFFWLWFFSCGHLYDLVIRAAGAELQLEGKVPFLGIYCGLLFAGMLLLARQQRALPTLSAMLNIIALTLVTWHTVSVGTYEVKRLLVSRRLRAPAALGAAHLGQHRISPNIYYIVLDGYARADILREIYHYDNGDFLGFLQKRGFHVVPNARANYCQTHLSFASALNLDYLDDLAAQLGPRSHDRRPLLERIRRNRLFAFLRKQGYHIIAFPSGYSATNLREEDARILKPRLSALSEFQRLILKTTPVALLVDFYSTAYMQVLENQSRAHTTRILYSLEHMPDAARSKSPVFVLAHIICPHPPFWFDRNGQIRLSVPGMAPTPLWDGTHFSGTKEDYIKGYREQLIFVNKKIKEAVDEILEESRRPTVIIIQADHGPGAMLDWENPEKTFMKERLGILLAYHFPDGEIPVYDDLSPVNIFRLVLDHYFGANLPLLRNESYYSTWTHPYRFLRVTDKVEADPNKP